MPKSDKLVELEAKLIAAKKLKNLPLCKLLYEAMKKQVESDAALAADNFDAVFLLDNDVHSPKP